MTTINVFTIIIEKESKSEPALYYNHITNKWITEFQLGCGCTTKEEAFSVLEKLDVQGAFICEGITNLD